MDDIPKNEYEDNKQYEEYEEQKREEELIQNQLKDEKGKYYYNNNASYREYHKAFMTAPKKCELCDREYMRCNYYRHLKTKKHKHIEKLLIDKKINNIDDIKTK